MQLPERTYEGEGYRYGFNGKEMDNEVSGNGNQYDYGFRIYNPRLGRFLSKDPLFKNYAMLTPYQFASNTPIQAIDIDGLEAITVTGWMENGTVFNVQTAHDPFTNDMRILYIMHDVGTGEAEERWVHPVEIRYEPSAGEKILTGTKEFGYSIRDAAIAFNAARVSFDRKLMDMAQDVPDFEGEYGFHNGGKQIMLGTAGVILSGGTLLGGASGYSAFFATTGLLSSFDDMTYAEGGTTFAGRLLNDQQSVDRVKLGFSVGSLSLGVRGMTNSLSISSSTEEIWNISSTIFEGIRGSQEIKKEAENLVK